MGLETHVLEHYILHFLCYAEGISASGEVVTSSTALHVSCNPKKKSLYYPFKPQMSKMSTVIPANPPPKGSLNRRVTMDKSGINTKGTNIQVVLRCK